MKKLVVLFILILIPTFAFAKCTFTQKRIKGMSEVDCRLAQKEAVIQKKIDTKKREQAIADKEKQLQTNNSGSQSGNTGGVQQTFNVGGGGSSDKSGATDADLAEASYFEESIIEIFGSTPIFLLSAQQQGAKRQFLTGQNSTLGYGVRYKFAKGVHFTFAYEKFKYKGKEYDRRDPSKATVEKTDEHGHVIYDDDGKAETEEVTSTDNSYRWAEEYTHTRYMIGVGTRWAFTDDRKVMGSIDVFPVGWYSTHYSHSGDRSSEDDDYDSSKAYGFRAAVDYRVSPDLSITSYYQMIDAVEEGDQYADQHKPLGSATIGIAVSIGLPDVAGKLYY